MIGNPKPVSPYIYTATDAAGKVVRLTVAYDDTTRAILTGTSFRDSGCQYTKVYIGLGTDGAVETTIRVVTVPAGTRTITATTFANVGLHTIEDVLALQITAGP